ncbi:MAG: hypothetical protein GAK30_02860 [Paracidovorax wautersii]|uniref:Capsule biosynthesis GfcC n=1 Tax=Paracidovorax wautersii TaxID=1177982 RepID=A0A7V8FM36_9BURK|nr:MAG: hypothetical protein GAK30_02860 [Paracidovorax wautersii]
MCGTAHAALAADPAGDAGASTTAPVQPAVVAGERLSAWLFRLPATPDEYPAGLVWQVPQEKPRQQALKEQVVLQMAATGRHPALVDWLRQRPVTGRATVAIPDARWLATHPDQDPILQAGHAVRMPRRPGTVTVVLENGQLCQVPHRAGALAPEYLRACVDNDDASQRDQAWIAQPDGQQLRYGIGLWNAESQLPPAPGAWIWAPRRDSEISAEQSDYLIRFLATQGPAPDGLSTPTPALANGTAPPTRRTRDLQVTASDWGEIGLLQTPTARMAETGAFRVHVSRVQPYTRGTVMFQPLEWFEAGFRYTDISDRLYDPSQTIATQSYKDKSIDFKIRLWPEYRYIPQVALGVRDFGGTGLFSGEYVVANKRTGNFDWSLGMGWGYLGARGDIGNPLGLIASQAKTRPGSSTTGTPGSADFKSMFRGRNALFGGVQWQTPLDPLILKLEYDGNDYKREPAGRRDWDQKTPINVGAVYRYSRALDFTVGYERGNKVMVGFTLHTNLAQASVPKVFDPPAPPVQAQMPTARPDLDRTARDIGSLTGWAVESMRQDGQMLHVIVDDDDTVYRSTRTEKALAVLHRDAPADVRYFALDFTNRGLALDRRTVNRSTWVERRLVAKAPSQRGSFGLPYSYLRGEGGAERVLQIHRLGQGPVQLASLQPDLPLATAQVAAASASNPPPPTTTASSAPADNTTKPASATTPGTPLTWTSSDSRWRGGFAPSLWQSFGGPDAFMLYQIGIRGSAEYSFTPNTWISGGANFRLLDNYDKFKYVAPSNLPRVRTNVREYVTDSRLTIDNLQLTHVEQFGRDQFVSAYGGLLESMYAGVGGEWLYRPVASRWALGVDINRVKQRGFDQKFSMRDYSVTTGHATLYWDTGWNGIKTKLSAGQYLAGDKGATLDISRTFTNGVTIGAWATKTNVSSAQFGEGSFDLAPVSRTPL